MAIQQLMPDFEELQQMETFVEWYTLFQLGELVRSEAPPD